MIHEHMYVRSSILNAYARFCFLSELKCEDGQFRCSSSGNGPRCMSLMWRCDGEKDCDDNSDEEPGFCSKSIGPEKLTF